MTMVPSFSNGSIESLAVHLGNCGSGSDITRVLASCELEDNSGESTKWKRLYRVFSETQRRYGCANRVIEFIQAYLDPARFVGRNEEFEGLRQD